MRRNVSMLEMKALASMSNMNYNRLIVPMNNYPEDFADEMAS